MTDCPNGEMRDKLPDLLHDRLAPAERREVEAHLASCSECRAELALLAELRASLHRVPAVSAEKISAAIPAYRPALVVSSSRRAWGGWRVAAAITVLVAGGASAALLSRGAAPERAPVVSVAPSPVTVATARGSDSVPASRTPKSVNPRTAVSPAQPTRVVVAPSRPQVRVPAPVRELAVGAGSTGDLTTSELNALLKDIGSVNAVPSTDVEGGTVTPTRGGS